MADTNLGMYILGLVLGFLLGLSVMGMVTKWMLRECAAHDMLIAGRFQITDRKATDK